MIHPVGCQFVPSSHIPAWRAPCTWAPLRWLWVRYNKCLTFTFFTACDVRYTGNIKHVAVTSLRRHPNSIYSSVATERDRPQFSSSRSQWMGSNVTWPVQAWVSVSKIPRSFFLRYVHFVSKRYIGLLQPKCRMNRNMPASARNSLVQLIHRPWEPQCTASQRDRQTDDMMMPTADHTV